MITVEVRIIGVSPLTQSRPYERGVPSLEKESAEAYENRTWRNRLHVNELGNVFIPAMSFKYSLSGAAKFLGLRIKEKGRSTWTKHFESGVLVIEGLDLGIKADKVQGEWLFLNADGVRGSGRRVWRCMPKIPAGWEGSLKFYVVDATITQDIFMKHLEEAGKMIGVGQFRPERGGYHGRFSVKLIEWVEPLEDIAPAPEDDDANGMDLRDDNKVDI